MTKYVVFHPNRRGWDIGVVSSCGQTDSLLLEEIVSKIKTGTAGYVLERLLSVPDWRDKYGNLTAKKKDATTLGALFSKPKNRGSNIGLTTISSENRYKGKVDWEDKRTAIGRWMENGASVTKIAKKLGVSTSALSKANKRHNLYSPKQPPC